MRILLLISILFLITACQEANTNAPQETAVAANAAPSSNKQPSNSTKKKSIIFFGDSLTAAYGLQQEQGFASLIQKRIDEKNLTYKVVNAGLSGETSAGGVGRINWILKQAVDIFILELGGNDGLRGIPTEETYKNLSTIAKTVKDKYPNAQLVIAGMEAPPNMGKDFTDAFRAIFPKVAKENDALLIPFLLDGVGGIPELNLPDGIHPTPEGHQIVAENVWAILKDIL